MEASQGQDNVPGKLENGKAEPAACFICRKPAVTAAGSCETLDKTILRNMWMCMEVPRAPEDLEQLAKQPVPFCARCRDLVVPLSFHWQQLLRVKASCESIRDDLIFTAIEASAGTSVEGSSPLEQIRAFICQTWMPMYEHKKPASDQNGATDDSH